MFYDSIIKARPEWDGLLSPEKCESWRGSLDFEADDEALGFLLQRFRPAPCDSVLRELAWHLKDEYQCGARHLKGTLAVLERDLASEVTQGVLQSWSYIFPEAWDVAYLFKDDKPGVFVYYGGFYEKQD